MIPVAPEVLSAFVLTAGALVLSPGPDTALILRYTLASGRAVGLATVAGVQLGLLVHTALAVAGVSLLIASSPALFKAVAVLGALYLAWLGLGGLRGRGGLDIGGGKTVGGLAAARDAMVTNVLNPKVIVLFVALFPNFVAAGRGDATAQLLTLAAVLIGVNVLWQTLLAVAAERARTWLTTPRVTRWVARSTGLVLLGFAVLMIVEHLA